MGQSAHMRMRWTAAAITLGCSVVCGCAGTPAALFGTRASAGAGNPSSEPHTVILAAHARQSATLAVVSGATTVTVSVTAVPGQLLRVWTPANSGVRPQVVQMGGRVQVFLDSTGQSGPSAVAIQLSSAVRWDLQFSGGAAQTVLDLSQGKIGGIDFTAGSSLISMTLPKPAGTTTITLAGGASQVSVSIPAGVPARLRLYGGAGTATVGGHTYVGVGGGTVLTPAGWASAADRYDVAAPAGVSTISVTA
jgi:hypothetical protein